MHPGSASLYNWLGNLLFEQGQFPDAARQYEYAVALRPDDMKYVSNLGAAYTMLGEFALAATYYERAIAIKPQSTAHSNLGTMRLYTGEYQAAIEHLKIAVELAPNDYFNLANLGDALLVAERHEEAWRTFARADELAVRALAVNNNDPYIVMDLAWIKSGLGEDEEAHRLIDRALRMAPDDPQVHYYSGLIHNRTGSYEQALAALKTAADLRYPVAMLAGDPNIENLKGDSRFRAIIESSREEK